MCEEKKKKRYKNRGVQKHINNSAEFGSSLPEIQVSRLLADTGER
jgi:hypothetical protein